MCTTKASFSVMILVSIGLTVNGCSFEPAQAVPSATMAPTIEPSPAATSILEPTEMLQPDKPPLIQLIDYLLANIVVGITSRREFETLFGDPTSEMPSQIRIGNEFQDIVLAYYKLPSILPKIKSISEITIYYRQKAGGQVVDGVLISAYTANHRVDTLIGAYGQPEIVYLTSCDTGGACPIALAYPSKGLAFTAIVDDQWDLGESMSPSTIPGTIFLFPPSSLDSYRELYIEPLSEELDWENLWEE